MRRWLLSGAVMMATLALAGCESGTGVGDAVRVATVRDVYEVTPGAGAEVAYTVTNTGEEAVRILACGETLLPTIERRVDGRWTEYDGLACAAVSQVPEVTLPPGASVSATWRFDERGAFRIGVHARETGAGASARVVSNPFEIR